MSEPEISIRARRKHKPDPQKTGLEILLWELFGEFETSWTCPWLIVPQLDKMDNTIRPIFQALRAMWSSSDFASPGRSLSCDYFIPSEKLIIEYDEIQHFTCQRAKSLELYPTDLQFGFDCKEWLTACQLIKARDSDRKTPYRDEQRAYYDSLKDILAAQNGMWMIRLPGGHHQKGKRLRHLRDCCDWTSPDAMDRLHTLLASRRS